MSDEEYTGPIGFAVFAVPEGAELASATAEIARLADARGAEILDVELIARSAGVDRRTLPDGIAAAETDLLHEDDVEAIVSELAEDEHALVVIYEDRTLAGLASRISALGGRELLTGGIDAGDLDGAGGDAGSAGGSGGESTEAGGA